MKLQELLNKSLDSPIFSTGFLLADATNVAMIRVQLGRWVKAGKLIQLRRGVYCLAQPYRKVDPHPFFAANFIKQPSYVSLQSALSYWGMIPEYVPTITSITTGRPEELKNELGSFMFRHIRKNLFYGYREVSLGNKQKALVAVPEKALLDLMYLTPGADTMGFLQELRLQNLERLEMKRFEELAIKSKSLKLRKSIELVRALVAQGEGEEL